MARSSRRRLVERAPHLRPRAALRDGPRRLWLPGSRHAGLELSGSARAAHAGAAGARAACEARRGRARGEIGERNLEHRDGLERAARYLEQELAEAGYHPERDAYPVGDQNVANVYAERKSTASNAEVVVIGRTTISRARHRRRRRQRERRRRAARARAAVRERETATHLALRRLRQRGDAALPDADDGKLRQRTARAERGDRIAAMLSLETLGHYTDAENSQRYPAPLGWFFPSRGDFVAFVGNSESRDLVRASDRGRFGRASHSPPKAPRCPRRCPASPGRITRASGRPGTRRSW